MSGQNSSGAWEVLSQRIPYPSPWLTAASIPSQKKILVFGGLLRHVFDANTQTWEELPFSPWRLRMTLENTVFVMGGTMLTEGYSDLIGAVTIESENGDVEWEILSEMITPRFACAAATSGWNIFAIGGHNETTHNNDDYLSIAEMFDIRDRKWDLLPQISQPKAGCSAVAVKDKIYLFGGRTHQCTSLDTAEMLDLSSKRAWEPLPTMPQCRYNGTAVAVGVFILLIGGRDHHGTALDSIDCYDTISCQWIQGVVPSLHTARYLCGTALTHCGDQQGEVHVFGGRDDNDNALATIEKIRIDICHLMLQRLLPLFQQDDLPLSLWPHILASCPVSMAYSVLLSEKFHLDSVLVGRTRGGGQIIM